MRTLAEIRRLSGFRSQKDFALVSNCTRSAVAKWKKGISYPSVRKLPLLSVILGVSEGEIIEAVNASKNRTISQNQSGGI